MQKKRLKNIITVIKKTFGSIGDLKIMKLSSSLAYTTVFALAPLLALILFLCGLFFGREAVEGSIYAQIKGFTGPAGAAQVQTMISSSAKATSGTIAGIISGIALIVAATSLFAEIQDSLNTIWGVRPRPGKGWKIFLKTRLLSFGVIISLGFLLLVSLGISAVLEGISGRLVRAFSDTAVAGIYIVNLLLSVIVITILFAVIFKVLPDAKIKWKQIRVPAFVTALLFMIGKLLISLYISRADIGSSFGAAGSLVILLVWIYYSSAILYIGASFAKEYALAFGEPIEPAEHAEQVMTVEVSDGDRTLQEGAEKKEKVNNAEDEEKTAKEGGRKKVR